MTFATLPQLPIELLSWGFYLDSKNYLQFTSGPYRKQRVHRVMMQLALGRELRRDEVVHHRDGDKTNLGWGVHGEWNLQLMGEREHNAVSAKQAWWMKTYLVPRERAEWEAEFGTLDDDDDVTFP